MRLNKIINSEKLQLKILFFISAAIFTLHFAIVKSSLYSDIRYYYLQARSVVIDHDLDFGNEFLDLGLTNSLVPLARNPYPVGTALFLMPALLTADNFASTFSFAKIPTSNYGYNILYQMSASFGNIFLTVLGYLVLKKILENYFSKSIAFYTAVLIFFGTNVFFYSAVEPLMSHSLSFFISTLFVYVFLMRRGGFNYYKILGILAGVAGLIRTQDLLLITLPLLQIIIYYRKNTALAVTFILHLAACCFLAFLPQMLYWKYFYNTFWYSPFLDVGFNFSQPQIFHVLLNTQNGAFTITPVIALSILGLFMAYKKNVILNSYILIFFLLQLYLVSSWNVYTQGGSFGIRMLISTLPLLSLGLGRLLSILKKNFGDKGVLGLSGGFVILNQFLIVRYLLSF